MDATDDGLSLPKCRICGVALMPQSGVAFRAGRRVLFVTCEPHAEVARRGVALAQRVAMRGLREFLQEKAPTFFAAMQEVAELAAERRERTG